MPNRIGNVLSWASDIEDSTIEQAQRLANLPFVQKPLALMADAHIGKGATIGSVIATEGAIIPSAVGVDIGCGMMAVRTSLTSNALPDDLSALHDGIRTVVPAGVGKGHENRGISVVEVGLVPATAFTARQVETAAHQFGSLGSGNHFVEICLDETDRVWIVLHSGSRGIGNQLAQEHIKAAKGLMKDRFINLEDPDLAYLVESDLQFHAYIKDMLWAQRYAYHNRQLMMHNVISEVTSFLGGYGWDITDSINCHHNFTQQERQRGKDIWITRKGAISARVGERGVIPGSMGTRSYIVTGLGNPGSYFSSSHGAGRRLSRSEARKTLSIESLQEAMEGRTWNAADANDLLDEHPASYKDIDQVMEDQKDLVSIDHTLTQILNYKGTK